MLFFLFGVAGVVPESHLGGPGEMGEKKGVRALGKNKGVKLQKGELALLSRKTSQGKIQEEKEPHKY